MRASRKYRTKDDHVRRLLVEDMPLSILQSTHAQMLREMEKEAINRSLDEVDEDKDAEEF